MKTRLNSILISILVFVSGCNHEMHSPDHSHQSPSGNGAGAKYTARLKTVPAIVRAGESVSLVITVNDPNGAPTSDLEIVHQEPLHLLLVSDDLAEFYHLHPYSKPDGTFATEFTFQNGGKYHLYADFKPKSGSQTVERISLQASGIERSRNLLKVTEPLESTVEGLRVRMGFESTPRAGSETMLNFSVFDAESGKPATDLENYLGEKAHFVILSADAENFVHAHPMSTPSGDEANAGGVISAHTTFPNAGVYKIWAQFKRSGKVVTVPFVINVVAP